MNVDRTRLTVVDLRDTSDRAFWRVRTPFERLRAVQINRQVAYGRTSTSERLQRILEVAERV